VLDGIDISPELLTQATELEDGVKLGSGRQLFQEMNDLLSERAVLTLGALLKLLVEIVREVLDVERGHGVILHIASILEDSKSGVNVVLLPKAAVSGSVRRQLTRGELRELLLRQPGRLCQIQGAQPRHASRP